VQNCTSGGPFASVCQAVGTGAAAACVVGSRRCHLLWEHHGRLQASIEIEHRQRRWSARVDGTRRDVAYREAEKVAVFSEGTEDKRLPSFSRLPKVFGPSAGQGLCLSASACDPGEHMPAQLGRVRHDGNRCRAGRADRGRTQGDQGIGPKGHLGRHLVDALDRAAGGPDAGRASASRTATATADSSTFSATT
jgi:hypothetical protein